jgi:hypothetical protein
MAIWSTPTGDPEGIHGQEEPEGTRRAACPLLQALRELVRMHRLSGAPWSVSGPIERIRSTSHDDVATSSLGL